MMAERKVEIGIVGAGLFGRTLALRLLKNNFHVTLFDRDAVEGEASCAFTGAGMLAPYCELDSSDPIICALGEDAPGLWSEIVADLPTTVFLQNAGTVVVSHPGDDALLKQLYARVSTKHASQPAQLIWLDADDLLQLEPSLAGRFDRGLYASNEGQIDNRQLLNGLAAALIEKGCNWNSNTEVDSINGSEICAQDKRHNYDFVVDCRGLGAKDQLKELRGVRGEMIEVHAPEVVLTRPVRMLHPRYAIYVVPRPGNRFLIGATSVECEDYRPITVLSTLELLSAAYSLDPAFAQASITETRVNCRPAMPNNQPLVRHSENNIEINGLYRHGFLITPMLVSLVAEWMQTKTVDRRFAHLFVSREVKREVSYASSH